MRAIPHKWYKVTAVLLVGYALICGLLIPQPLDVGMLGETIRNLFYHVPMWFGMMIILAVAWVNSMMYLNTPNRRKHVIAMELTNAGILMGLCGLCTGMLWASFTWGTPWTKNDPKLMGAAIGMCMYGGYWLILKSVNDEERGARLAAVYNVFVYPLFISVIYVMPKLSTFSVHPGSGDTVNFKTYDNANTMRLVFYPAVIGWTLLFAWIGELRIRYQLLKSNSVNEENTSRHIIS